MSPNLIKNEDFEADQISIFPWTCTGGDLCGINSLVKGFTAPSGENFGYVIGAAPDYVLRPSLSGELKKGKTYKLSYYAYSYFYDPNDSNDHIQIPGNFTVQIGEKVMVKTCPRIFDDRKDIGNWPFWSDSFVADGSDHVSFLTSQNSVFSLDKVSLTCKDCSPNRAGAIAGGVVGGLAGLGIILLTAAYFILRRRRQNSQTVMMSEAGGSVYRETNAVSPFWFAAKWTSPAPTRSYLQPQPQHQSKEYAHSSTSPSTLERGIVVVPEPMGDVGGPAQKSQFSNPDAYAAVRAPVKH